MDHFERVFFTERKRLDYEMTSEKHNTEQQSWKEKNLTAFFEKPEQRVDVTVSLSSFKKQMSLHPDLFKADYATFKL